MVKTAAPKQKLLLAILAGLLMVAAIFSGRYFLADIYYYQGKRYISKAEARDDNTQRLAQLQTALSYLDKAIALNHHSDYLTLKAGSLLWQSGLTPDNASALQQQAQALYQTALKQRPSDAYLWLGLAESLVLQGQKDAEFSHAIKQASRLGFHEGLMQRRLLSITLPSYRQLNNDDKAVVRNVYQATLKAQRNNRKLIALGQSNGLFAWFCATHKVLEPYPKSLQHACGKLFSSEV